VKSLAKAKDAKMRQVVDVYRCEQDKPAVSRKGTYTIAKEFGIQNQRKKEVEWKRMKVDYEREMGAWGLECERLRSQNVHVRDVPAKPKLAQICSWSLVMRHDCAK
jgi:hypothetical protein